MTSINSQQARYTHYRKAASPSPAAGRRHDTDAAMPHTQAKAAEAMGGSRIRGRRRHAQALLMRGKKRYNDAQAGSAGDER